jgi:hypothetical protein
MSALFFVAGLVFLVSGGLSVLKFSEIGLDIVSKTQIHTLPFLSTFPVAWVYLVLGIILIFVAGVISRR